MFLSGLSFSWCVASISAQMLCMLRPLPDGALFNPFWLAGAEHNALHVNAGHMDAVWIELSRLYNLLHLGNCDARRRGHYGIKVAGGLAENQVAPSVRLPGFDQGEIGFQSALHHIHAAIEFAHLLAFRNHGASASRREECWNTGASCPYALRQRALRIQLKLNLAAEHKLLEQFVLADVGADMLLDLAGVEKLAQTKFVHARVIGDGGQVFYALADQGINQIGRNAAQPKPADHNHAAVGYVANGLISAGNDFIHKQKILNRCLLASKLRTS